MQDYWLSEKILEIISACDDIAENSAAVGASEDLEIVSDALWLLGSALSARRQAIECRLTGEAPKARICEERSQSHFYAAREIARIDD